MESTVLTKTVGAAETDESEAALEHVSDRGNLKQHRGVAETGVSQLSSSERNY